LIEIDSNYPSEEVVQNPQHTHYKWAFPDPTMEARDEDSLAIKVVNVGPYNISICLKADTIHRR